MNWIYAKKSSKKSSVFQPNVNLQADEAAFAKQEQELTAKQIKVTQTQLKIRRQFFDYEAETKMAKTAFTQHGLVKIPVSHALTWNQADILARSLAGGLPTREDLIKSQVNEGDTNFWTELGYS